MSVEHAAPTKQQAPATCLLQAVAYHLRCNLAVLRGWGAIRR